MSFYTYSELAEFRYQKTKKKMAEIAKSRKGLATEKQRKYIKDLILKRFSEEDQDRFLKALGKKQLDKLSFADACVMIEILTEKTVLEVQALIDKQKLLVDNTSLGV